MFVFCALGAASPPALQASDPALLAARLEQEVLALENHAHAGGRGVRVGVLVYDLDRRELLFSARPDTGMAPASSMKVLTTAAALDLLGQEFAFCTRAGAEGAIEDGVLHGDLILKAGGDPSWCDLVPERAPDRVIASLAAALQASGIRRISGRLMVDATCFDRQWVHPDWPAGQLQAAYCAPVGGLNMAAGCVAVIATAPAIAGQPLRVHLEPRGSGLNPASKARSVASSRGAQLLVGRRGDETVRVEGQAPIGSTRRFLVAVADPVLFAGRVLAAGLERDGLAPAGGLGLLEQDSFRSAREEWLWEFTTPLSTVVGVVNKESQNLMAEHLLKSLGRVRAGAGSFEAGARVVQEWLGTLGAPLEGIVVRDGSGLSAANRLSARSLALVLARAWRAPWRETFLDSLPLGGIDGTLEGRMAEEALRGRVQAKTGWIRGASALAGFLGTGERTFCFAILVDYPPSLGGFNRHCKAAQDRMLSLLAHWAEEGKP